MKIVRLKKAVPWPKGVISLDIETRAGRFANPEQSQIVFVGIRQYVLEGGRFEPRAHVAYRGGDLATLENFLKSSSGPIIGFNILKYDFRVLRNRIDLEGVIERSVDLLALVYAKCRIPTPGLKLDNLCLRNLGRGKTIDSRLVSRLWDRGRFEEVIRYNENDCDLVFWLWCKMMNGPRLQVNDHFEVLMLKGDLPYLCGENPLLTFQEWQKWILTFPERDLLTDIAYGKIGSRPRNPTRSEAVYLA